MDLLPIDTQPDYLKLLIYGQPDAGKTTMAASGAGHPEFTPTVIMDIEGGLQSVRWGGKGLLRTPRVETPEQIEAVIMAAASGAGAFAGCKCLVIDSLTKMSKILLQSIVAKKHAAKPRKGGVDQIERSDYGDLGKAMERYVDMLIGLDMHVILIALEKNVMVEEQIVEITLGLPGALPSKMVAACDNVFALKKMPEVPAGTNAEGVETPGSPAGVAMLTQTVGLQFARVRNRQFREALEIFTMNPTLPAVWDVYNKSLEVGRATIES
jgi:hypothetical protein